MRDIFSLKIFRICGYMLEVFYFFEVIVSFLESILWFLASFVSFSPTKLCYGQSCGRYEINYSEKVTNVRFLRRLRTELSVKYIYNNMTE